MKSHLPNVITIVRIMLVPLFTALVYYMDHARSWVHTAALAVFCLCALSDALDGILARGLKAKSFFGTILDPVADKLLLLVAFIGLAAKGILPVWVTIIIVARDVMIIAGVIILDLITGVVSIKPRFLGKVTTFLQMTTIILAFVNHDRITFVIYLTALSTILSGIDYAVSGTRNLACQTG